MTVAFVIKPPMFYYILARICNAFEFQSVIKCYELSDILADKQITKLVTEG